MCFILRLQFFRLLKIFTYHWRISNEYKIPWCSSQQNQINSFFYAKNYIEIELVISKFLITVNTPYLTDHLVLIPSTVIFNNKLNIIREFHQVPSNISENIIYLRTNISYFFFLMIRK